MIGTIATLTLGKWVVVWKMLIVFSTPTESGLIFNKFEVEPDGGFSSKANCKESATILIEKSKKYPENVEYLVCVSYRKYVEEEIIYY